MLHVRRVYEQPTVFELRNKIPILIELVSSLLL